MVQGSLIMGMLKAVASTNGGDSGLQAFESAGGAITRHLVPIDRSYVNSLVAFCTRIAILLPCSRLFLAENATTDIGKVCVVAKSWRRLNEDLKLCALFLFVTHVITTQADACSSFASACLNGDDDLDVLSA